VGEKVSRYSLYGRFVVDVGDRNTQSTLSVRMEALKMGCLDLERVPEVSVEDLFHVWLSLWSSQR